MMITACGRVAVFSLTRSHFTFCSRLHSSRIIGSLRSSGVSRRFRGNLSPGARALVTQVPRANVEELYLQSFMNDRDKYPNCTVSDSYLSGNADSANRVVALLRKLVRGESVTEEFEGLEENVFTINDLIESFHHLSKLSDSDVDPELLRRLRLVLAKQLLRIPTSDRRQLVMLLHQVRLIQPVVDEMYAVSVKIYRKLHQLSTSQLVEYFYFLHFYKKSPVTKESRFQMEKLLVNRMTDMTTDELTVIALALFRCKVSPSLLLSGAFGERTAREFDHLNEFQASILCKVECPHIQDNSCTHEIINYGNGLAVKDYVKEILRKFVPRSNDFHIIAATRIACVGIRSGVSDYELVERLIERETREMDTVRIKDIERLLLASCHCNYRLTKDSPFVRALIDRLEKTKEKDVAFPISFISTVAYLVVHGIFLDDFIDYTFSSIYPTYVDDSRTVPPKIPSKISRADSRQFVFIDYSLELERPDYTGARMPERFKLKYIKAEVNAIKSEMRALNTSTKQLRTILKELYTEECVAFTHPLPQYSTYHSIMGFDNSNRPVPVGDDMSKRAWGTVVSAPQDGNRWLTFIFFKWDKYLSDGVTLNLISETKIRHFRAAGYHPIAVSLTWWRDADRSELVDFVRNSIEDALAEMPPGSCNMPFGISPGIDLSKQI